MNRIDNIPTGMLASMQKDIMEGKPSELDHQIGAVIRMGKMLNIPTPTYEKIYSELLPFEQKARGVTWMDMTDGLMANRINYFVLKRRPP